MWTCTACGRKFKNKQQRHRCQRATVEDQLQGKPDHVIKTWEKLNASIRKLKEYHFSPIKDYIMVKHESTFLTIKPRKNYVDISFFLDQPCDEFPIFTSIHMSKNRILHGARLESPEAVNATVTGWIKASYQLTKK